MSPRQLTVLYDATCEPCRRAKEWLERQPKHVEMAYVAAGSALATQLYPEIDPASTLGELTVVGDDGSVYRGAKAFIACLWALREHWQWAARLASPEWMPHARRAFESISKHRRGLGWYLGLVS